MANNEKSPLDQPCSKEIQEALKGAVCKRITWDYQIYAAENELKADKRIAIWARYDPSDGPVWKRLCVITHELDWTGYHLKNGTAVPLTLSKADQDLLKIVNNTIEFKGGFLKIKDPGLKKLIEPLGFDIGDVSESELQTSCREFNYKTERIAARYEEMFPWAVSDYLEPLLSDGEPGQSILDKLKKAENNPVHLPLPPGRNIHIEVEFKDNGEEEKQPLFYFPQNDDSGNCENLGVVFLGTSNERRLYWTISNQYLVSDEFKLESGDNSHQISVSQDINWFSKQLAEDEKPYFEMMVDSIGLGISSKPSGQKEIQRAAKRADARRTKQKSGTQSNDDQDVDHDFGTGPRTFWVGFVPHNPQYNCPGFPTNQLRDEWKGRLFEGTIKRLYFDPNSSCSAC